MQFCSNRWVFVDETMNGFKVGAELHSAPKRYEAEYNSAPTTNVTKRSTTPLQRHEMLRSGVQLRSNDKGRGEEAGYNPAPTECFSIFVVFLPRTSRKRSSVLVSVAEALCSCRLRSF